VKVVSCHVEVSASGLQLVQERTTECGVSDEGSIEAPGGRTLPGIGSKGQRKKNNTGLR
jgi:hypothetical protein